jgi:type VII secretion protein EccE
VRRLGVGRVVCWQLALVAVVLSVGRPWWLVVPVAVLVAVVVALTTVRVRGRWLGDWLVVATGYLLRERDRDLDGAGATGLALLRLFAPEAAGATEDGTDDAVFVVSRAGGVSAVLQPRAGARDLAKVAPDPAALLPPASGPGQAFAVQVVHHAGTNRDRPPRVWVVLQALRTVSAHRDAEVRLALANAVRRVCRQLRRAGCPTRALSEDEVLTTLAALAHVNRGRGRVREGWRQWRTGPVTQAVFRLDGWAALSPGVAAQLVHWLLAATPEAAVTLAVTAHRPAPEKPDRPGNADGAGNPSTTAVLRVAATTSATVERAERDLTRLAREWGVAVTRLDGEHARGVAATLLIGLP